MSADKVGLEQQFHTIEVINKRIQDTSEKIHELTHAGGERDGTWRLSDLQQIHNLDLAVNKLKRQRNQVLRCFRVASLPNFSQDSVFNLELERKKQELSKAYYDTFPNIENLISGFETERKEAETFTESILHDLSSGNAAERKTICHVLNKMFKDRNLEYLFFDSTHGKNLHDASIHLADLDLAEKPFVLKLKSSEGLGGMTKAKNEEAALKFIRKLINLLKENKSHPLLDDITHRLSQVHGVERHAISLKTLYAGTFSVVYTVHNPTKAPISLETLIALEKKFKEQFHELLAAKIHPMLFRPTFDITMFQERGNKTYDNRQDTFFVGPPGKTIEYKTPVGWTRYSFNIIGKFADGDHWLHIIKNRKNWYRSFLGTKTTAHADSEKTTEHPTHQQPAQTVATATKDALTAAAKTMPPAPVVAKNMPPAPAVAKNMPSVAAAVIKNIQPAEQHVVKPVVQQSTMYCTPNPQFPEDAYFGHAEIDTKNGIKKFKCILQVAVNPDGVKFSKKKDTWIIHHRTDVRPYGILIKEA